MIRVLLLALVACGGNPGERNEPPLAGFERKMCACKDKACAQRVVAELAAWSKRVPDGAPAVDPATAAEIMKRYNACMATAIRATPASASPQ